MGIIRSVPIFKALVAVLILIFLLSGVSIAVGGTLFWDCSALSSQSGAGNTAVVSDTTDGK